MATTRAERMFTAGAAEPRGPALAPVATFPQREAAGDAVGRASRADAWSLARDAAGAVVVLGSWAALWAWFLAATL